MGQPAIPMNAIDQEDLVVRINNLVEDAQALAGRHPSRDLSLVITKLEEAEMWAGRIPTKR